MQSAICINESQTEVIKQRDHIWQNFVTLEKYFVLGKAICEGFYYLEKNWIFFVKFCMPLGRFSLV